MYFKSNNNSRVSSSSIANSCGKRFTISTKYDFNILGRIFNLNLKIPTYLSAFEKGRNENIDDTTDTNSAENDEIAITDSIPTLKENNSINIHEFVIKEIEAKTPQAYKESDFIPLLQKEGIGRPSTYASFVPTLPC